MLAILIIAAIALAVSVVVFVAGAKYGAEVEQQIVGTELAKLHSGEAAVEQFINRLLASLKNEYSFFYDKAVADFDRADKFLENELGAVKKAL